VLVVLTLLFTAGAGYEICLMLGTANNSAKSRFRVYTAIAFSLIPPLSVYITSLLQDAYELIPVLIIPFALSSVSLFMLHAITLTIIGKTNIQSIMEISFYLFYMGAMSSCIIAMLAAPLHAGPLIIWFSAIVFANDSLAWLIGINFGKTKAIFNVSPAKSLEGTIAGITGSILAAFLGPFLLPVPRNWLLLFFLGLACAITAIFGDLFESTIKRSVGFKDSGTIIPGRGGILDSFDSLLFTAPVFLAFAFYFGLLSEM
jgi:phosphatidate cytidylyltransferase